MIHLIRASHANQFELQNFVGIKDLQVVTSHHPLTPIILPHMELWSPTDLPTFPYRRQILNRLIGGEQWLLGLRQLVQKKSNGSNHRTIFHTAETYTPYTHQAVELKKKGLVDKLICTCWETIAGSNEKFARLRKWKTEAYRYVDLFHTPTLRAKQALITEGVDQRKIKVIPYGVDLTRFRPKHLQGQSLQGRRPVVLTVARLEREKGMEDIVRVASLLPQYDFQVVGRGSYIPRGENIAVSSVPYNQIHRTYQSADLFFLPSQTTSTWEEQYGMVLVEAMASGLPIIATDSGAIREVVGEAGVVVEEKNVDKMVKTIHEILSHPEQISLYSRSSLSRAKEHFDASQQATKLSRLYS